MVFITTCQWTGELTRWWQSVLFIVFSLRLVMPPMLFGALQAPFTRLGYILFPTAVANGIISGSFAFCGYFSHLTHCLTPVLIDFIRRSV